MENEDRVSSESTLTKADLVERVYSEIGFSKKEAAELVELVFEIMKSSIYAGENVKISGFGNFMVRKKRQRMGRNPQTGEQMIIEARRVLTFRHSQVLKAILNGTDPRSIQSEVDE